MKVFMKRCGAALMVAVMLATMGFVTEVSAAAVTSLGKVTSVQQTGGSDSKVEIAFAAVMGASYYEVEMSSDGANYTLVNDYASSPAGETIYQLSPGSKYSVRVRAWGRDSDYKRVYGEYSDPITVVTAPSQVTGLVQADATVNSVTLAWNAAAGANTYYVKDGNGTTLATTNTPSATVSNLAAGYTGNLYVTPAVNTETATVQGQESSALYAKTLPAKMTEGSYGINYYWTALQEISFTWNTPTGADGVQIVVTTIKGNKKVFDTDSSGSYFKYNAYRKKGLRYRARAYVEVNGAKKYGAWSSYHYFAVNKVEGTKGYKKIRVTWNKVDVATKYKVYVSTAEKSGYKLVKKVGKKANSCTITKCGKKKLKSGKTYYVKVVPVLKSGKKSYSSELWTGVYGSTK